MRLLYFKKVLDEAGNEWVAAEDLFNYTSEMSPFFIKWYSFIVKECQLLNYFNDHTSTAYGNPDYMYLKGVCAGWLAGRECYEDEEDGVLLIKNKNNKTIMKFDLPKISEMEKSNRKELTQLYEELLG